MENLLNKEPVKRVNDFIRKFDSELKILVLDTGFYTEHESINENNIIDEWDFINNDSETQNEAEGRIQNNTPNTKIIHNFHSIEDDMVRIHINIDENKRVIKLII